MRRFYEQSLWIPQNFLFTNLDLHHGLLGLYLKRPPSEELGFETLCKGASDTAT